MTGWADATWYPASVAAIAIPALDSAAAEQRWLRDFHAIAEPLGGQIAVATATTVVAVYAFRPVSVAVHAATSLLVGATGPLASAGIAAGAVHEVVVDRRPHISGSPIHQAEILAHAGRGGAIHIAERTLTGLPRDNRPATSAPVRQIHPAADAISCREVIWAGHEFGAHDLGRPASPAWRTGLIKQWNPERRHGFVLEADGRFHFVGGRHLAPGAEPRIGQRACFTSLPPEQPGKHPVAGTVITIGQVAEVTVTDIHPQGFGFGDLTGAPDPAPPLHLALRDVEVAVGDTITVTIIANRRGPSGRPTGRGARRREIVT